MSRVGKNPIPVPSGVDIQIAGRTLSAKGKLGNLAMTLPDEVTVKVEDGKIVVTPDNDDKRARTNWGTTRSLVNNMVHGVSAGFTIALEISGVGYRASVQGSNLNLQLGYSHDVVFPIPDAIKIVCERPTAIAISGADRQQVGQVAAKIRSYRPPEPYKGKGIKYAGEQIRRKEGKKK